MFTKLVGVKVFFFVFGITLDGIVREIPFPGKGHGD